MTALAEGAKAPDFSLPSLDGGKFSLKEALQRGPVVAAFFKISCPVCQYTFPFFERLRKAYGAEKVALVGISQDDKVNTSAFLKEYGITFPTLLDDPAGYAVSNAYGLTNVPTWFFIEPDGEIKISSVGWVRGDVEALNRRLADAGKTAIRRLFLPKDDVRDYRPG
ncbi:MAG: TlpA disulfide reductase family protein [Terriglobales bacterium]|jgi:cytochrome c biogenesis protein CcmG, thiol:disulfide interchange protein DsbE